VPRLAHRCVAGRVATGTTNALPPARRGRFSDREVVLRKFVRFVVTKSELIEEVARQVPGLSKRDVEIVVETIFETMSEALVRKDRIEIRGFGSFVAKRRRAREGHNPRRPEIKVSVPPKHVPFFTCGKELRERVNELTATSNEQE
jgi:integration host factor subunit beta